MPPLRPSISASRWLAPLCLVIVACPEKKPDGHDPSVIATVNGEMIARSDFEQELSRDLHSSSTPSPDQTELMKRALLDTMVERTLLLQAARANNVTVTAEEVDRGVLRISADYPAERFNEALAQGHLSLAELKHKTAALLTIEKLFQSHVYPRVAVTEEEIRRYFAEHEPEFEEPEQVRAAQIVVKELDEAKRIQAQLRAGKKFADLARKYSLSADAKVGGDLGFFPRGVMPPQFDEVAFNLGVNQTSDVVATDYGFHLFKILAKRPGRKRDLTEVRREVEERLLEERRAQAQGEFLKALKDKADIRVNEPVLLGMQVKTGRTRSSPPDP
jgi:peptidyl-prolyl cis-trans isomerase C